MQLNRSILKNNFIPENLGLFNENKYSTPSDPSFRENFANMNQFTLKIEKEEGKYNQV